MPGWQRTCRRVQVRRSVYTNAVPAGRGVPRLKRGTSRNVFQRGAVTQGRQLAGISATRPMAPRHKARASLDSGRPHVVQQRGTPGQSWTRLRQASLPSRHNDIADCVAHGKRSCAGNGPGQVLRVKPQAPLVPPACPAPMCASARWTSPSRSAGARHSADARTGRGTPCRSATRSENRWPS